MGWKAPGERLVKTEGQTTVEYLTYLRHVFGYETARQYITPASRVLDVGCGIGYGTQILGDVAAHVTGVDVAKEAIAAATSRARNGRCTFRLYDGRHLPFENESFDLVTSFHVLEHVQDDAGFLAEIRRVVRPNGRLFLSTPNKALRVLPGHKHWWRYHVREYTPVELRALLQGVFPQFEMMGLRGTPEIEAIEESRIAFARKLARIDPLDLRRFVPQRFVGLMHRRIAAPHKAQDVDFRSRFHVSDFRLEASDLPQAIDLFAVCYPAATLS